MPNEECNDAIAKAHNRIDVTEGELAQLKTDLATNTKLTVEVRDQTKEMVEFYGSMQGAFKVLNMIGKLAKPISAIMVLIVAVVGVWDAVKAAVIR